MTNFNGIIINIDCGANDVLTLTGGDNGVLELKNIKKVYTVGSDKVHALKGVDIAFRKSEMVAILGQSGCGKTTLLNIIGGLDRYTSGDLTIDGRSTEYFKASDWDAYRNQKVGFVFQSYNLIPHLTVLGNVELALTLSGIKKSERRARAIEALRLVGLESEIKKRPNQMSGGQMQRVAIARAIVNNPDIVLADEPTGALDSNTGVAVMEILKEIARDRLVIMVTHNRPLAEQYSTRIISMLDGMVIGDTAPVETSTEKLDGKADGDLCDMVAESKIAAEKAMEKERKKQQRALTKANRISLRKTSMSLFTAFGLSWRNLVTKKGRTIATAVAGSIGIIGVALVLALSNGFNGYIEDMQTSMLAHYPVTASNLTVDMQTAMENLERKSTDTKKFPTAQEIIIKTDAMSAPFHYNRITQEYVDHVDKIPAGLAIDVTRDYARDKVILSANTANGFGVIKTGTNSMNSMVGTGSSTFGQLLNNTDYVKSQYDILKGKYPTQPNEIALVISNDNSVTISTLRGIGIKFQTGDSKIPFDDIVGKSEFKLVHNNQWFIRDNTDGVYRTFDYAHKPNDQTAWKELYDNPNNLTLTVVGIMRIKEGAPLELFSTGLVYTPALTEYYIKSCMESDVADAQRNSPNRYISNEITSTLAVISNQISSKLGIEKMNFAGERMDSELFNQIYAVSKAMKIDINESDMFNQALQAVGAVDIPSGFNFYPVTFDKKAEMIAYLEQYNAGKTGSDVVMTLDVASIVTGTVSDMIDIISYVLIAFAAISLVVSSVMISIITYASVAERIKEIGVLRAVGARRIDIMRVFIAETAIIGFVAGIIGVLVTLVLSFPISSIFISIADGMVKTNLVAVAWWHAIMLIGISVLLTLIAGVLPARSAARRDPVVALRSE